MSDTWCVWAAIPYAKGNDYGWSNMASDLTQPEAEWLADKLHFRARAMPVQAGMQLLNLASGLCNGRRFARQDGHAKMSGPPCEPCALEAEAKLAERSR